MFKNAVFLFLVLSSTAQAFELLQGVSCVNGNCSTVGGNYYDGTGNPPTDSPLAFYSLDSGNTWAEPLTSPADPLESVACKINGQCAAVGQSHNGYTVVPRSYVSDDFGRTWLPSKVQPIPLDAEKLHYLFNISCTEQDVCTAVGAYRNDSGNEMPLSYISFDFGQTWSLSQLIEIDAVLARFFDVSCASNGLCSAVGEYYENFSVPHSHLAYFSNDSGFSWTRVEMPLQDYSRTTSVACVNSGQCSAVGITFSSPALTSFVSKDFGQTWIISTTPPSHRSSSYLNNVFCLPSGRCVAVGDSIYKSTDFGDNWTLASATPAVPGGTAGSLTSVSCESNGNCIAVGGLIYKSTDFGDTWTQVEHQ